MPERSDFWSRRRRAVAAEEERESRDDPRARAESYGEEPALDDRTDAELLQMFGLPDPETLTPADAARFMAREIPARLRRRAIRSLFRNHPELSMPDGLQDYDLDYTKGPDAVRPARTVWQVPDRLASFAREPAGSSGAQMPDVAPSPGEIPSADEDVEVLAVPAPTEAEDEPLRPRRMSFRFEDRPA